MMEENGKKMTLPIAFLIMLIIVAMIMTCIKTGVGIVVPLFLSWLVVYIFCRILGFDFDKVFGAGMLLRRLVFWQICLTLLLSTQYMLNILCQSQLEVVLL